MRKRPDGKPNSRKMTKYQSICDLIERRIKFGDYALSGLPPEIRLASEIGVSRMTARKAVHQLVEKGLLVRKPNGRLIVNDDAQRGESNGNIGLLRPAFASRQFDRWQIALEMVAAKMKVRVRKVDFVHWDDPSISEAIDAFDGIIIIPGSEPVSKAALQRFQACESRVVVVDEDWSQWGLRSLNLSPASQMRVLLDYLYGLGHRVIACINTQSHHLVVDARLAEREAWHKARGLGGRLIDEPVLPYEDSVEKAHEVMSKLLKVRAPDFTAIVASHMGAALGATRALIDAKIRVGTDVSVAAVNDEGLGKYLFPSITSTQTPDSEPFLQMAVETILNGPESWYGPLAISPEITPLFIGESTGPCPPTK